MRQHALEEAHRGLLLHEHGHQFMAMLGLQVSVLNDQAEVKVKILLDLSHDGTQKIPCFTRECCPPDPEKATGCKPTTETLS